MAWYSSDGGATWDRAEANRNSTSAVAVGGSVVFLGSSGYTDLFSSSRPVPVPMVRLVDGEWTELPVDAGQWGDGYTSLSGVIEPNSGRYYGRVGRTIRTNPHYCFEDPTTCQIFELALVTSVDGLEWFDIDVAVPELRDLDSRFPPMFFTLDGRLAIAGQPYDDQGAVGPAAVLAWEGDPVPPLRKPEGYSPPAEPVPLYYANEALDVGVERRYAWGLGGCGGMYIDNISWEPTGELNTTGWPLKEVDIIDGPSAYTFGRVTRISEDVIEFQLENQPVTVTLKPTEVIALCG